MTFSESLAILHSFVYICIHNFLGSVEIAGVTVISFAEIKIKCRNNENSIESHFYFTEIGLYMSAHVFVFVQNTLIFGSR